MQLEAFRYFKVDGVTVAPLDEVRVMKRTD
jgi:hypothetical protein